VDRVLWGAPHFSHGQWSTVCFEVLQQVSAVLGVQKRVTSASNPATNGQVERFNRTALAMLSHYVAVNHELDKQVGPAMAAYNASVHSSTGFAPQEMIRAEAPRILLTGPFAVTAGDKGTWRRKFLENLAVISKKAKERLASAQKRYKSNYYAHVRERNAKLITGDWVFVKVFADSPTLTLPLAGLMSCPRSMRGTEHILSKPRRAYVEYLVME
jgi:hypothetical protein